MSELKPLGIGIIGFGRIGAEHAGWIARSRNCRVVAVADPTPLRRAKAEHLGVRAYPHHHALLKDPDVDAVLVSTPTAMHHNHAGDALAAGKHVMVEKPMALDFVQAKDLVQRARDAGCTLSVFHNRRWDLDYLTLKNAIEAGTFGSVINVESRIGQWASCVGPAAREWHPNWRNESAFGGGGLYDWGSHFVDQLWRMMLPAKPVRVYAQLRANVWSKECDDLARVVIDFDGGAVGVVEINTTTTRPLPRWHVDGTFGSADSAYSLTFDLETWGKFWFTPAGGVEPEELPRATAGLSETEIWERFEGAVGGRGDIAVSAASVLPTMALMDAARESSQRGCAIAISDNLEWVP
ncbi:MAG TPA: Gfo/Idh/MocA family oxidoreductase [Tepidisphaeraceae bacterium]